MNPGGDAAEQVVRLSLEGVEVAAKISGYKYAEVRQGAKGLHDHTEGSSEVLAGSKALWSSLLCVEGQKQ